MLVKSVIKHKNTIIILAFATLFSSCFSTVNKVFAGGQGNSGGRNGYCGDGICGPGEDLFNCPQDCQCGEGLDCGECGNGICEYDGKFKIETADNCPQDCGKNAGGKPASCGDGSCTGGESLYNCPEDCTCGDGICGPREDIYNCPQDCDGNTSNNGGNTGSNNSNGGTDGNSGGNNGNNTCGDGICGPGEYLFNCPQDCQCGEGLDCGECGNGICEYDGRFKIETDQNCPQDCGCNKDGVCEISRNENLNCSDDCFCGNGACDAHTYEDALTCPQDCAENNGG